MAPRIAIVGAGAVGGYAGAHMVQAGHDVTFIDGWPEHVEAMRKAGLTITHLKDVEPFNVGVRALNITDVQGLAKEKPIDIAFICVKSYDTAWSTAMIKPYLAPDGYVVSLQNCINEPVIAGIVGEDRTLGSIASSITVELTGPGQVFRAAGKSGASHTVFRVGQPDGKITDRVKQVCDLVALTDSALMTSDLGAERWTKLTLNVMGNGVSACTGQKSRDSIADDRIRQFMARLGSRMHPRRPETRPQAGGDVSPRSRDHRPRRRRRCGSKAHLRREPPRLDQEARRRRASSLHGPGHGEGPPHRDRVHERAGGREGQGARHRRRLRTPC